MEGHILGSGQFQKITKQGTLPTKIPGKHRWIALLSYNVSEEKARGMLYGNDNLLHMDRENLAIWNFGCIDCEVKLDKGSVNRRCFAKKEDYA